jgi:hypothetical protein
MPLLYTVEEILVRMICELRPGITKALDYFTMLLHYKATSVHFSLKIQRPGQWRLG